MANSMISKGNKLFIETGMRFDMLRVGDLVADIFNHPLFVETPQSYLKQGRLRECVCDCGKVRLIAESILATDRFRSCGCKRANLRMQNAESKLKRMQRTQDRKHVNGEIRLLQQKLRIEQIKDASVRDEKTIQEIAAKLRTLFAIKSKLLKESKQCKAGE